MVKIEIEKQRIGIRLIFDKPKPFFRDGFEIVLFPPKGLPWYNLFLPYRYERKSSPSGNIISVNRNKIKGLQ